jgi:hypothetical protein
MLSKRLCGGLILILFSLICQKGSCQVVLPNGNGDLGTQINSAIAALPESGGKILIQTQPGGQCYLFMVPIVINKAIILEGQGPSTCLKFQGVGSAITFTNNTPPYLADLVMFADGAGLRDFTLFGSDPSAGQTGLEIGGAQWTVGFYAVGVTIANFGLGLKFDPSVWNFKMQHSMFSRNGQNVYWPSTLHFGGENVEFDSVTFVGATFTNSLEFDDEVTDTFSNLASLTFVSCNFDDAQLVINNGAGSVRLYAPHFENPGKSSGTQPFMRIRAYTAASDVVIDGPDFYNDLSGPYPSSFLEIDGGPTVTITQMRSVNLDGSTNVPANIAIAGNSNVTLLGDAPLRATQQQYVVLSGNPTLWVMGGQDVSNKVQSPTPMLYSQTVDSADNVSPVVQIGGTDWNPTVGFNLWTGSGNTYYGMQIKETGPNELDFCSGGANLLGQGSYLCNAGVHNGVLLSRVPDGVAPLSVTSHTPPDNLNAWPATFSADGSQVQNPHITTGKVILPGSGIGIVTFAQNAQFSQTPVCTLTYQTGMPYFRLRALSLNPFPGKIAIFGEPWTGVFYVCIGN